MSLLADQSRCASDRLSLSLRSYVTILSPVNPICYRVSSSGYARTLRDHMVTCQDVPARHLSKRIE